MMMLLALSDVAWAADARDCPQRYADADIRQAAEVAGQFFGNLDAAGFERAHAQLQGELACAVDVLAPGTIAQVHAVEVLDGFLTKRLDREREALAGLYAVEPLYEFPEALVPSGHPVRAQIPRALSTIKTDPGLDLPRVLIGFLAVDGRKADRAPKNRSAVVQQVNELGDVTGSHYVWPSESDYGWVLDVSTASSKTSPWTHRAPLLGAAAAGAVASAVLLGLASSAHAEFIASPTLGSSESQATRDAYRLELEAEQGRADGFGVAGYATGALAVGLGIVAVIRW